LKVTFDLADDTRLTEWQSQRQSQSVELFAFSFFSQAAISAFAESSASSLGLVAPNPVAAERFAEAPHAGLREQFANGFEMRPELNRDYQVEN
jgi:hypothetical protein